MVAKYYLQVILLSLIIFFGLVLEYQNILTRPSALCANRIVGDDISRANYCNKSLPVEQRVSDLLSRMSLNEKIGQLALTEKDSIHDKKDITRYRLGALLSGGGGKPKPNTPAAWLAMVNSFQGYSQKTPLKIPLLYGVDAVHGNASIPNATVFPHNIGLGAANDADLMRRIGEITTEEMSATGIYWDFAPSVDVPQDIRWGRVYESFGDNPTVISKLATAYIAGLQSPVSDGSSIIATAKHYIGTGAMVWGTSGDPNAKIDQGVAKISEATLRSVHLPPFIAAVKAGVGSVMVSHTTWHGVEMAASHHWLTDVLKDELGFKGFVVSDWYAVYAIPGGEYHAVVTAINAGVDMVMLPYDYKSFVQYMQQAIARGDITTARLDDAVSRILTAKFTAGLFDNPPVNKSKLNQLGSTEHRQVAQEAVRKSLVVLKDNQHILPLSKTAARIVVAGSSANNLGRQSGGWTIEWQGIDGNGMRGTTILDAVKKSVSKDTTVDYDLTGNFSAANELADVGIAVVGESPYAEGRGDNAHPVLSPEDLQTIAKVKSVSKKLVVIIISGRPLDIKTEAKDWDTIVAAWLPGSEGEGVTDVLFGDYKFSGTLPLRWDL